MCRFWKKYGGLALSRIADAALRRQQGVNKHAVGVPGNDDCLSTISDSLSVDPGADTERMIENRGAEKREDTLLGSVEIFSGDGEWEREEMEEYADDGLNEVDLPKRTVEIESVSGEPVPDERVVWSGIQDTDLVKPGWKSAGMEWSKLARRTARSMMLVMNELAPGITSEKELMRALRAVIRAHPLCKGLRYRTGLVKIVYQED